MDTSCVFGGISLEVSAQNEHLRHFRGQARASKGQARPKKGEQGQERAREAKGKKSEGGANYSSIATLTVESTGR